MEAIIRNVRDMENDARRVLECIIGQQLRENQQLIFRVVTLADEPEQPGKAAGGAPGPLPDWCDVYDGFSEQDVADLESIILQRANFTRPSG